MSNTNSNTYSQPGDLAKKMEEKLLAEKSVEGLVFGYHFTSKIIELSNAMEVMVNSLEDYKRAIFKNQGTIEYLKKEINNLKSEIFTMKDENRHIRKENYELKQAIDLLRNVQNEIMRTSPISYYH